MLPWKGYCINVFVSIRYTDHTFSICYVISQLQLCVCKQLYFTWFCCTSPSGTHYSTVSWAISPTELLYSDSGTAFPPEHSDEALSAIGWECWLGQLAVGFPASKSMCVSDVCQTGRHKHRQNVGQNILYLQMSPGILLVCTGLRALRIVAEAAEGGWWHHKTLGLHLSVSTIQLWWYWLL